MQDGDYGDAGHPFPLRGVSLREGQALEVHAVEMPEMQRAGLYAIVPRTVRTFMTSFVRLATEER